MATTPRRVDISSRKAELIDAINALVDHSSDPFTAAGGNFTDTVTIEKDQASAFNALVVINNTANAAADVLIKLLTVSGSGGDTVIWFNNNVTNWTMGLDNSDADAFVISQNAALGTTNALRIDATSRDVAAYKNLGLKANTAFTISFTHTATADRIVTLQDLAGTIALLGANVQNAGNLEFVDATYDIGSNSHRPRNLFLSGAATVGGNVAITGTAAVGTQPVGLVPTIVHLAGNYTLTSTFADIGLATGTLAIGTYLITAVVDYLCQGATDVGLVFLTKIVVGTATATFTNSSALAVFTPGVNGERATVSAQWVANVTVAGTLKLQANKSAATVGTSIILATDTSIAAST